MNFRANLFFFSLAILCCLSFVFCPLSFSATPEPPSTPPNYVVDLAGIIRDDVEAQLNQYLRELEKKTTAQIVVLTIQSLDGQDIEGFSISMAEKWKLGQKGKDNGLLITVALKDRKYRFEVGYGLEGILPDSLVGSIGRQYILPYFKKGDYTTGIFYAATAAAKVIASHEGVEITAMPKIKVGQEAKGKRAKGIGLFDAIIIFAVFAVVVFLFIKHPRLLLLLLFTSSMGRRRGGWSGGGGFGGGGFGGFGGGGGGFGGGGASGRW